ncbi:MAG: urate hydroxylase PuuD [Rhodospirillales bacterium]|nr:urate hydroxylase PuuD [Rhodospirillales bacterium]
MNIAVMDWAALLFRWLHITTGIAWIGSSFFFVFLDLSLRKRGNLPNGVSGDSWMVHGGGFYHSQKYMVAPDHMPEELHWFKYEAYFTWISGIGLMGIMYYWGAESFLIDPDKLAFEPWQAIAASLMFLAFGWIFYDLICKSPLGEKTSTLALCVFVLIVAFSWGLLEVFSGRAAFLHVGAIVGSMMVGNVFFVIIPNQKRVVADLKAGREPDPALGIQAKQRSTHNNYLTLPVLLMMISNHYPVLFGQSYSWAIIALILLIGGVARHYFNTSHAGGTGRAVQWQWPVAAALMVVLIVIASYQPGSKAGDKLISSNDVLAIMQTRCVSCHAAKPADKDFEQAPGEIKFDSIDVVRKNGARILNQVVISKAMPLANRTKMTDLERQQLGAWIRAGMPQDDK